uniref:Uncharacterized protein n=1 Tax=Dromaius novaehollandiae TaxID=8790 RepID=A0A8C4JTR1_DRONO
MTRDSWGTAGTTTLAFTVDVKTKKTPDQTGCQEAEHAEVTKVNTLIRPDDKVDYIHLSPNYTIMLIANKIRLI